MTKKTIVKNLDKFKDRIVYIRDRINQGQRPRRGNGYVSPRRNKAYQLGGQTNNN